MWQAIVSALVGTILVLAAYAIGVLTTEARMAGLSLTEVLLGSKRKPR